MCDKIHVFEKAGLGKAPFRYVGMEFQDIAYGQRVLANGATTKPGGTCDYCGTYIVNIFLVESADGRKVKVGCDCVRKTGDAGLVKQVEADVQKMQRERRQAQRIAAEQKDFDTCKTADFAKLARAPHPIPHHAEAGKTLADYVRWLIDNRYFRNAATIIKAQPK